MKNKRSINQRKEEKKKLTLHKIDEVSIPLKVAQIEQLSFKGKQRREHRVP